MLLPTEKLVTGALVLTRDKFPLGSSNKVMDTFIKANSKKLAALKTVSPSSPPTHWSRINVATSYIGPPRNTIQGLRTAGQFGADQATYEAMCSAFDNYPAGNCYDMALYAFGIFGKVEILPLERIVLVGGDHSFVAVGRFRATASFPLVRYACTFLAAVSAWSSLMELRYGAQILLTSIQTIHDLTSISMAREPSRTTSTTKSVWCFNGIVRSIA